MIRAIDSDILGVEEGPSREGELGLFIRDYPSGGAAACSTALRSRAAPR
jgi:hypothetical protein